MTRIFVTIRTRILGVSRWIFIPESSFCAIHISDLSQISAIFDDGGGSIGLSTCNIVVVYIIKRPLYMSPDEIARHFRTAAGARRKMQGAQGWAVRIRAEGGGYISAPRVCLVRETHREG